MIGNFRFEIAQKIIIAITFDYHNNRKSWRPTDKFEWVDFSKAGKTHHNYFRLFPSHSQLLDAALTKLVKITKVFSYFPKGH